MPFEKVNFLVRAVASSQPMTPIKKKALAVE